MHRTQLLDLHAHLTDKAYGVMQKKNNDYASNTDPFFNLRQCQAFGLCSVEQGILVRITDKLSRLSQYAKSGNLQVKDESVEDTLVDIINYTVLLHAYLKEQGESQALESVPD